MNKVAGFDLYDPQRELVPIEYSNLVKKSTNGYIPVNFFRSHLFNSTSKQSKELKRKKVIYDDGKTVIKVNRSLHQRHRDLLSLIFTENKGVSKPSATGEYFIYVNIFDLAKKMGYKSPKNSRINVKEFLDNIRSTDLEIRVGDIIINDKLLGKSYFDRKSGYYIIEIPAITAKYHILNYGVLIHPSINREIIKIPNNLSRLKALVSYVVSNKPLDNGISFVNICNKLDVHQGNRISEFKKEIINNKEYLAKFNIIYLKDKEKFMYGGIDEIKFERAIKPLEVEKNLFDMLDSEQSDIKSKYIGKKGFDGKKEFEIRDLVYDNEKDSYKMYFSGYVDFAILEKEDLKKIDTFISNYDLLGS